MLIHYTGDAGARHIGDLHWTRENHYTVDVADAQLAANLITTDEFEAVPDAPLSSAEARRVAEVLGTEEQQVRRFISRKPGRADRAPDQNEGGHHG